MNLRSLLVAGLATMAASGANAGDAIVATEPEPLEYVRICDGYGTGYFFIPGTETCLRIGGKIRIQTQVRDPYSPKGGVGSFAVSRAELSSDTATDTEYGTLKTNFVLREESAHNGPTTSKLLWGNISLGGFLVGKQDSQYNLYTGYAGNVVNDDVIYDGPKELNQLTYFFDPGNGFTAVASIEDSYSNANTSSYGGAWKTASSDHYLPDGVIGLGYKTGAVSLKVVGGYDSVVEEGAVKARLDVKLPAVNFFLMGGWNTDGNQMNRYAASFLNANACPADKGQLCGWGDWAIWGGASVPFNDKVSTNVEVAYTDSKIFEATANLQFKVKQLVVTPEVTYTKYDSIDDNEISGVVRFERRF